MGFTIARKAGALRNKVAVDGRACLAATGRVGGTAAYPNSGDAQLIQREEFARIRDSVLIEIAPDFNLTPGEVRTSEVAIGVAIQIGQGVEGIGCLLPVALDGVNTEQLSPGLDIAIAVEVTNKDTVVRANPAGARLDAVGVVVEQNRAIGSLQF
ncbi:hypothetical protein [Variovorax sp. R-27]|uniref:hypothetical protein n=1 Tax=Variovorax sp. R-27 TaxID=3404058 RepID=UPI003CFA8756